MKVDNSSKSRSQPSRDMIEGTIVRILYFHVIKRMHLYPQRKKTTLNNDVRLISRCVLYSICTVLIE